MRPGGLLHRKGGKGAEAPKKALLAPASEAGAQPAQEGHAVASSGKRPLRRVKKMGKKQNPPANADELVLRIIGDLKLMGQALEVMESTIRKNPGMFTCANDFILAKIMQDRVQIGAIGVANAISWAHGEKYGRPGPVPIPDPPEFDNCPHCKAQIPYTFPGINCPNCGKRLREPNAWAAMMGAHPKEQKEVLADIDATE